MFSVAEFLDRARAGAGDCSDYRLSKLIGVTQSNVSNWRTGRSMPDGRAIVKLCALSGDDPEHVAAMIQAMRAANDEEAALWTRVAARLQSGYALDAILYTLAIVAIALQLEPVRSALESSCVAWTPLCIMSNDALMFVPLVAAARLAWRLYRLHRKHANAPQPQPQVLA